MKSRAKLTLITTGRLLQDQSNYNAGFILPGTRTISFSPLFFSPGKLASQLRRRTLCLSLQHLSLWRTYLLGSCGKSKRITWSTPVKSIPCNDLSYG
ncbi:hypothetical protein EUGRSUZ_B02188 [Eucalyptus grandis]|uniref:Uncharacterized protein n=2 Tax=Eucalyptus grandis TaxID=71139 RepID=A0ACC3LSU3_EUCGR|nr:hypothetical protein EUGRSUZ_B02188 [Eucalyptus grandis]